MNIDQDKLTSVFSSYAMAKKEQVLFLKLFFVAALFLVALALFFAYRIVDKASDKILVVNTGGEMLPLRSMEEDALYTTLLTTHCYSVSYYVNSFDVNNIKNNQSRAAFLVNQADLNAIFNKYQFDKAYSDAINKGTCYRCTFDRIESLRKIGNGSEYEVVFSSTLSIIDNAPSPVSIRVVSRATAIRTTPRYPENPTGFYFKSYLQEYYPIN